MTHKNDYSCTVFFEIGRAKKWGYVHNLKGFASFLDKKHPSWSYFNIYNRRTNEFIKQVKRGSYIPAFLPVFVLAFILAFCLTYEKPSSPHYSLLNDFNNTATIWTLNIAQNKGGIA
ncbi:MAG: hypothetical protein J0I09_07500 [Sphingobacteriia bacterium]|nr:hypothetical protein [Sphingobacteriia bacterium]